MTDIKRHLPEIFKLVKNHLSKTAEPEAVFSVAEIRAELTALLPASYGVTGGRAVNAGGATSSPFEIIIYDNTIPGEITAPELPVHKVLAVIELAQRHTQDSLTAVLDRIKSIKVLKPGNLPAPGKPGNIPKQLFPLGIVLFSEFEGENNQREEIAMDLANRLRVYPPVHRPDYLFAFVPALKYRNPLIDGFPLTPFTLGFCREPDLTKPRICYICKEKFVQHHFYYEGLCRECGDFNYLKRIEKVDLSGKIALVTGARVKIGYAVALRLLRAGAMVIALSRFPHDTARRYALEPDFAEWQHRLHIYGLDFRHIASLQRFITFLQEKYPRLDILINNAAQTVRRPPAFYAHLLEYENLPLAQLPPPQQALLDPFTAPTKTKNGLELLPLPGNSALSSAELSQIPLVEGDEEHDPLLFPPAQYDRNGQQLDKRPQNSWEMRLEEISVPEIVEVQTINVIAPTILISQLKGLMARGEGQGKFIINVSAVEGKFSEGKQPQHPHTNMAKAALNMLTHTSAVDYAQSHIFMNSVDPGWVSEQSPLAITRNLPIDEIDAAARVCDPIFSGIKNGEYQYGKFWKDYRVTDW